MYLQGASQSVQNNITNQESKESQIYKLCLLLSLSIDGFCVVAFNPQEAKVYFNEFNKLIHFPCFFFSRLIHSHSNLWLPKT